MVNKGTKVDAEIAGVAGRQHGVITTRQLEAAGLSRAAISRRAGRGRLHRVHRGVYAVGCPPTSRAAGWMAAVLAYGDDAALSHGSAAALWGVLRPFGGAIDVSVPSARPRDRRRGIRVHRLAPRGAPRLDALLRDGQQGVQAPLVTRREGIPVTSVQRTIDDLRDAGYEERLVRRAIRQAELKGYRVVALGDRTRSDLERDFLAFCRRHRLPKPAVNVKVGKWRVDFLWRAQRLVVETDFFDYHRGSVAYEDDHERDLGLRRLDFAVHRYTGDQLRGHPAEIAAELGEVLGTDPVPGGRGRGGGLARLPAS